MALYSSSPSPNIISSIISVPSMLVSSTLTPVDIKLDRTNYLFWKSQVLPATRAHDLETCVLVTRTKPNEAIAHPLNPAVTIVIPDYISWSRLDKFVMSWLLASISEQMLDHVVYCRTSIEVWTVLEKLFSTKSKVRSLPLRMLLANYQKRWRSDEDYVLKMKALLNSLMVVGE